ncbi:hypothetical protein RJT34_30075 [Clitoria ternatea]|uniref:Uncharacterized protein n=1 Tax=Clitoria ternatea TaxID=43366 RepID=A0AAN9ETX9_CLITE
MGLLLTWKLPLRTTLHEILENDGPLFFLKVPLLFIKGCPLPDLSNTASNLVYCSNTYIADYPLLLIYFTCFFTLDAIVRCSIKFCPGIMIFTLVDQ